MFIDVPSALGWFQMELQVLNADAIKVAMHTIPCSDLRKNLASVLDTLVEERETVIITLGRGKPAAVLMSLEEFTSWEGTLHLLRSQANAARLMEATRGLDPDAGKAGFQSSPE